VFKIKNRPQFRGAIYDADHCPAVGIVGKKSCKASFNNKKFYDVEAKEEYRITAASSFGAAGTLGCQHGNQQTLGKYERNYQIFDQKECR
jgi:hypothetical protein